MVVRSRCEGLLFLLFWLVFLSPEVSAQQCPTEYIRQGADYIVSCQYNNPGNNAHGAINNVTGDPTWVYPRENGLAILGLIRAAELLNDPAYIDNAQRAADYLVRVQDTDGAWFNQYSYDQPHDDLAKSPLSTAEVMIAFYKLGFETADADRKAAMAAGADFLLSCQDVVNKGGLDDGLLGGGKDAAGNYQSWRWASDNSFAYLALIAAAEWAYMEGDTINGQRYRDHAYTIIAGINDYLYISDPADPDYKVWHYAIDGAHNPQNAKGRIWINYAPQMLDLPAEGVGDLAVGEWIHRYLQKEDGAVVWADRDNDDSEWDESRMESPGYSFQAALVWQDLGQNDYADQAKTWAVNNQYASCPDTSICCGWRDWTDPINGICAPCWQQFIDTSFYAISAFSGGYPFTARDLAITMLGTDAIRVTFPGVLQSSADFVHWDDVDPPSYSPWLDQISEPAMFFRSRPVEGAEEIYTIDRQWQGSYSGVTAPVDYVITSTEEWQLLWALMNAVVVPKPEVPAVDFGEKMVLAVFMGQRPSSGYSIEITDVTETADELVVGVRETEPEPGSIVLTVLTQPYHAVEVQRTGKPVRFVNR